MSYIIVCLILGAILLIHETGHFIAARLVGIPIERFSIGFGPKLWGFTWQGTDFCVSLIPIGGYVLPYLESEEDFFKVSPVKRIFFSFGGPLANLVSSIPLIALYNFATDGLSLTGILVNPLLQTIDYTLRILQAIPMIFNHPEQLSGIVGIVTQGSQIVDSGVAGLLFLTILLNINLAILNLLPIPALDGGQIVLTFLEKLWPKSVKIRIPLAVLGWLFLISTMVYATWQDITRLLG